MAANFDSNGGSSNDEGNGSSGNDNDNDSSSNYDGSSGEYDCQNDFGTPCKCTPMANILGYLA